MKNKPNSNTPCHTPLSKTPNFKQENNQPNSNQNLKITFELKRQLTQKELYCAFKILKANLLTQNYAISKEDKQVWQQSLTNQLNNSQTLFISILFNNKLEGFACLFFNNTTLTLSELQLSNTLKGTRAVLKLIDYILKLPQIKDISQIFFSINKNNSNSLKTFTHLGAKKIEENEKAFKLILHKQTAINYIENISKRFNLSSQNLQ